MYAHEKKFAIPFVALATGFFLGGALFAHYILFPIAWGFFASFGSEYMAFMPRIQPAFALYVRLVLACGIVFQLPTVVLFLARMGVVTHRFLIRNFKYAVLFTVIFGALLTPPDVVTPAHARGPDDPALHTQHRDCVALRQAQGRLGPVVVDLIRLNAIVFVLVWTRLQLP